VKNPPINLSRLELEVLRPLWQLKQATIREIREALPEKRRPEYTTVQTIIYRLEGKGAVERVKKIGNAHVFVPAVSRKSTVGVLVDDLLQRLGGAAEPVMAHLVESGKVGLKELRELEALLQESKEATEK
jgi:BlaI family transcriptional regulator, penicillinase repressor